MFLRKLFNNNSVLSISENSSNTISKEAFKISGKNSSQRLNFLHIIFKLIDINLIMWFRSFLALTFTTYFLVF